MTISQLRSLLQDITGRRNLALDTTTCDRVLNRACRYAESLQETPQSVRRQFLKPAADAAVTTVIDLRMVNAIWVSDGTDRGKLAYIEYEDAKAQGLIGLDTVLTSGRPYSYSTHPAALAAAQYDYDDSTEFVAAGIDSYAYADVAFSQSYDALAILWLPPTDGTYTFDIEGRWWPRTLSDSITTNWWSVNQPETIAYFAAMFLAIERGNTEQAKQWKEAAGLGLDEIDRSLAEHEMAPWNSYQYGMHQQG